MTDINDRRSAAKEKLAAVRKAQARREKRNRLLVVLGVVIFIVAIAAAVISIVSQNAKDPLEDLDAFPQNVNQETGGISLGSDLVAGTVNEGAPVLDVYLDYTCSYCGQFEVMNGEMIAQKAADGDITLVYHPIALLDQSGNLSGFSGEAANASAVVADKAPEHYNDFTVAVFDLYLNAVEEEQTTAPTLDDIVRVAVEAGVPQEVADTFEDGEFKDWVTGVTQKFLNDGFSGTPTILLEGEDFTEWHVPGALEEAIDSL